MSPGEAAWRKSSHSYANGNCVAVLRLPGEVAVRDSRAPSGPALRFTLAEWARFTEGLKRGPACLLPPHSTGRLSFPDGPLDLPPLPPRELRRLPPPYVDEDPPI